MSKKKKNKKKKKVNYKETKSGYVSDGSDYKKMFKKAKGKLKIIEFEISKKKTLKLKIKYDKKKKMIVYLDPFVQETGRGVGISYISDPVYLMRILWDSVRRAKLDKELSRKKKISIEKLLGKFYKLEAKFIEQMQSLEFMFNKFEKKKKKGKASGKLSKDKTGKKGRKSKKSNNK